METFWGERIFIERSDFDDQLPKLSKKLVAYCRKFSKKCRCGVLIVQRISLTRTSFSDEVRFVYQFQIMSGNVSAAGQKFFDRVVKIAFYVPIGTLRGRILFLGKSFIPSPFSDMERIFFVIHLKLFPAELSKLHTICAWKDSEIKKILNKLIFPINFRNWAKT